MMGLIPLGSPCRTWVGAEPVVWKLALYSVLTAVLLAAQYPMTASNVSLVYQCAAMVLLVHSVVMVTDGACEIWERKPSRWSGRLFEYLLPVEPRGISQLVMLLGLLGAVALALEIRGFAESHSAMTE